MLISNQPEKISVPFANSGGKQPIPVESQVGLEDGRASFTDGFPPLTRTPLSAGGKPPFGTDMNGILYAITKILQWQSAGGGFSYDSEFAASIGGYPKGAKIASADGRSMWISLVDSNVSNPDTGGAGWAPLFPAGVIGASRKASMRVSAASTTASFTANQIVVAQALGGQSYSLSSISASINLSTVGAGGMNSGLAPASGWVSIYLIYNPSSDAYALLGVDSSSSVSPEVFSGSGMPGGFTASALISVWKTNSSRQLVVGALQGRSVSLPGSLAVSSSTSTPVITQVNIASCVPPNANACGGFMLVSGINTTNAQVNIYSDALGSGEIQAAGNSTTGGVQNISGAPFSYVKILTQQSIWWSVGATTGTVTGGTIRISSYDF
uniref:Tail fiber protein n=3 Tax=unclassified bacterial viruses TaxID=12333 RepID=A0AAU6W307_9VIRU